MRERVTIVTCTANSSSPLFIKHRNALFKYTQDFEWLVIDNREDPSFNHAREINRALCYARFRYMVFLDDDVIVNKRWLEDMLNSAVKNKAAVTGAVHTDEDGRINHAGGMVHLSGRTRHMMQSISSDQYFPYVCSAVFLLDMEQLVQAELYMDEEFRKYYQETDFCLMLWEKGYKTICSASAYVKHLAGATAGSLLGHQIAENDLKYFCRKWVDNGRLSNVLQKQERLFFRGGFFEMDVYHRAWSTYLDASALSSIELFKDVLEESRKIINFECGQELYGGACFHLGKLLAETDKDEAKKYLDKSLELIPFHKKAREIRNLIS